jgi:putative ABC transport system permease protein
MSVPGLVVAAMVGVGVAVMAALLPARAAARVSPLVAIFPHREVKVGRLSRTWPLGVLLWLGAMGLALWTWLDPNLRTLEMRPMALLCILVGLMTLAGTLLLLPVWAAGLVVLLRKVLARWGSMVGRLAAYHRSHPPRGGCAAAEVDRSHAGTYLHPFLNCDILCLAQMKE